MKKLILTAIASVFSFSAFAQGSVVYVNFANTAVCSIEVDGFRCFDRVRILGPDGAPINGSGAEAGKYLVALFYGRAGETTPENDFVQAGAPTAFLDVPAGQTQRPDFFAGGRRNLTGIETTEEGPGPIVALQVRGWAVAAPETIKGRSRAFFARAGNGLNIPPDTPPNFRTFGPGGRVGFTGFQIVPEPSSVALGLLSLGALAFLRQRDAR